MLAWPTCVLICEKDCDNIASCVIPAVDSTRDSSRTGRWNTPGPDEQQEGGRFEKFTWDINVNEHSGLSESSDLCKVYAGEHVFSKGGSFKDSEVNSLKGIPSHSLNSPDAAMSANLILQFSTQFLLFFQFLNFQGKVIQKWALWRSSSKALE